MKSFYRYLFCISAFALVYSSVISVAVPVEESFASMLASYPDGWDIVALTDKSFGYVTEPQKAKHLLVSFLKNNKHPTYRSLEHASYGIFIVLVFSLVGWLREKRVERKIAEHAPPEGTPHSRRL